MVLCPVRAAISSRPSLVDCYRGDEDLNTTRLNREADADRSKHPSRFPRPRKEAFAAS